ncbi:MAG: NAD-dependent epimerase/dehydratase family protein [Planctomycetota bacterium]
MSGFADQRVLVTGGAGFIGSHLVDALLVRGASVVVIDDLSTGSVANLEGRDVAFHEASILDDDVLTNALAGCRYVFHEAALVSVPQSIEEPERCHAVNVTGTLRVLLRARDAGVDRVVLASSCALYGLEPRLPSTETDPVDTLSPYAASKAALEMIASAVSRAYGLSTACLRYFNVFGPRQDPLSPYAAAVAAFARCALDGTPPRVDGDGRQTRDFVPVASIVDANLRAATASAALSGEVFNVGTGTRTSLLDLLEALRRLTGNAIEPRFAADRAGDVRDSVADITRARDVLGYAPTVSLEDGLREMLV